MNLLVRTLTRVVLVFVKYSRSSSVKNMALTVNLLHAMQSASFGEMNAAVEVQESFYAAQLKKRTKKKQSVKTVVLYFK